MSLRLPFLTLPPKYTLLLKSVLFSLALLPVCLGVGVLLGLWIYFGHGGDFGGFGAAPSDAASWVRPAQTLLLVGAIAIDIMLGIWFYRRQCR